MNRTCKFYNNTTLPIFVESWINKSELTKMDGITVEPGKTGEVPSITGEWYLHNLFPDRSHFKLWKEAGYDSGFTKEALYHIFKRHLNYRNRYRYRSIVPQYRTIVSHNHVSNLYVSSGNMTCR